MRGHQKALLREIVIVRLCAWQNVHGTQEVLLFCSNMQGLRQRRDPRCISTKSWQFLAKRESCIRFARQRPRLFPPSLCKPETLARNMSGSKPLRAALEKHAHTTPARFMYQATWRSFKMPRIFEDKTPKGCVCCCLLLQALGSSLLANCQGILLKKKFKVNFFLKKGWIFLKKGCRRQHKREEEEALTGRLYGSMLD